MSVLDRRKTVSVASKLHFRIMSLVHEDLYRLFRDPYKALKQAGVKKWQAVLEVGCGPGFFTVPAAEMVGEKGRVCALDINPVAIAHVREKIAAAGVSNVELLLADAAETGLPDQSFDQVYLFGLAHPIGDMRRIMAELHRLLKPGGTLAVEGRVIPPSALFRPLKRQGRITQFTRV